MTQRSFHWDGASVGDAEALTVNAADGIGYRLANEDYESPFVDIGMRMLFNGDEDRGVLNNWLNELAVTGVATPVQVDTGGAVVYGMPYENTVAVNVVVAAPTTDVRQDLIVLRRDWAAQTIRITLITGVEGGGVPGHTQSPAPDGTGIYDIPLASLSTTVGAVITVTDMREFCLFGTGVADGALAATSLTNASIDFADRATREQVLFIGANDMEAMALNSWFSYGPGGGSNVQMNLAPIPPWNGAANESGFRFTGNAAYKGVITSLWLPPANWAGGAMETYFWWVTNSTLTLTCYFRHQIVLQRVGASPATSYDAGGYDTYTNTYISGAVNIHEVYRTQGMPIQWDALTYPTDDYNHATYGVWWYNSAGAEDVDLLGIEIRYTGYV